MKNGWSEMRKITGSTGTDDNSNVTYSAEDMQKIVELLKELRHTYLFDLKRNGEPKKSIKELIELWDKVNETINVWEESRNE